MPRVEATISNGYQVAVPSLVRKMLDLKPHDKIIFDTDGSSVTVEKAETQEEQIRSMLAEFDRLNEEHKQRMTPEQKRFAEMSAGWTVNQYHDYYDNLPETNTYIRKKYGIQI